MSTENQNSAGTTSALAQKTGVKPLAKIIAGVCAAVVVLVALCSIFGDPAGVAMVKNSVWKYDDTVTFEEALSAYCERKTRKDGKGGNYFEDAKEFKEKASFWHNSETRPNVAFLSERLNEQLKKNAVGCIISAHNAKLVPVWKDEGETSTGVRKVKLTLMWEGDRWIEADDKNLDGESLAGFHSDYGSNFYRVKYEEKDCTLNFLIYPDGRIDSDKDQFVKFFIYGRY
ncbi:MAG: hypothetical protein ACI4QA_03885 [Candidatus Spyradosoma sp.]